MIPHLGVNGWDDYRQFLAAEPHRAFAIAPGGAWSWIGGAPTRDAAVENAQSACSRLTRQRCVPYAADDEVVFDAKRWPQLWRPYKSRAEADRAAAGMRSGDRFPELRLIDEKGKATGLSHWRGRVVVLHFWGSWCAPCRREMPDLAALRRAMAGDRDIDFVLLQVREPVARSREWMRAQGLTLPVFDSGSAGDADTHLRLADGGRLADREVAMVFPSTYILDRHGIVLLSHIGPVPRWNEYAAFLRDAAAHSGK